MSQSLSLPACDGGLMLSPLVISIRVVVSLPSTTAELVNRSGGLLSSSDSLPPPSCIYCINLSVYLSARLSIYLPTLKSLESCNRSSLSLSSSLSCMLSTLKPSIVGSGRYRFFFPLKQLRREQALTRSCNICLSVYLSINLSVYLSNPNA